MLVSGVAQRCNSDVLRLFSFFLIKPELTGSLTSLTDCVGSHQSAEGRGLWCPKATPSEWLCVCPVSPLSLPPPLRQTSQLSHHYRGIKSSPSLRSPFRSSDSTSCYPKQWSGVSVIFFFPLRGLLGPSALVQCPLLLFCLCCSCGGWCLSPCAA